ncbi:MAG: cytochrome b/b6 domain-containing protein [Pseudomonadota bacterium]
MAMTEQYRSVRYTGVAIALHWTMAALLIGMVVLGNIMFDENGREIFWLYQLHKSIGITILILTIARIVWRLMNQPPAHCAELVGWERTASHATHMAFYGLMLAIPLSGWLLVSTAKIAVPTLLYDAIRWPHLPGLTALDPAVKQTIYGWAATAHEAMSWLLAGLIVLHVAGALKHIIVDRVPILARMTPGGVPATRPSFVSYAAASGLALAVFAGVVGADVIGARTVDGAGDRVAVAETNVGDVPQVVGIDGWTVDADASKIGFSGTLNGQAFDGTFPAWNATIAFGPDRLADARAEIAVDVRTISASTKLYADTLAGSEWFDSAKQPTVKVVVKNMRANDAEADATPDGPAYLADAIITIKDKTVTRPLAFDVTIDGERATMRGRTTLSRKALNLGLKSDANATWISDEIMVEVDVEATRKGDAVGGPA